MNNEDPSKETSLYQTFTESVKAYIDSNPSTGSREYITVIEYKNSIDSAYNLTHPPTSSSYSAPTSSSAFRPTSSSELTPLVGTSPEFLEVRDAFYAYQDETQNDKWPGLYNDFTRKLATLRALPVNRTNSSELVWAKIWSDTLESLATKRIGGYDFVKVEFEAYKNETTSGNWAFRYDNLKRDIDNFKTKMQQAGKTSDPIYKQVTDWETEAAALNTTRTASFGYSTLLTSHTLEENEDYCKYTYGLDNIDNQSTKPPTYPNLPPYLTYTGCNSDERCMVGETNMYKTQRCYARNDPTLGLDTASTKKPELRDVDANTSKVRLSTARLTLGKDEQIISPNGRWAGKMQSDGNFVIYPRKPYNGELYGPARWATNTGVSPPPEDVRVRFDPAIGGFNVDHYSTILKVWNGWVQKWEQIHAGVGADTIEDARNWGGPNKQAFITDNGDLEIQEASGFRVWNSSGSVDYYKCLHQLRNINGSVTTMSGDNSLPNPNDIPNSHKQLMNQVVADGYIGYVYNKSNKTYRFLQSGSSVTLSTFDGLDTYLITSRSENLVNFYWIDGPMYMGTGQNILASTLDRQVKQQVDECARLSYDTAVASGFVYDPSNKNCYITGDVITDGVIWGQNQGYMSGWKVFQPAYDLPGYNSIKNNFEAYKNETTSGNWAFRYDNLKRDIDNFKTENTGRTARQQYRQVLDWETEANALNATRSAPNNTGYTPDQNNEYCKKYRTNDQSTLDYTECNADERCVVTKGYFSPYNCNGRNNMMIGADFGLFAYPDLTNYSADLSPAPTGITYTPAENFAYCQKTYPPNQPLNYTKCNADPRCVVSKSKVADGSNNIGYKCDARNTFSIAHDTFPDLKNETAASYFPIPWVPPTPKDQPPFRIDVPAGVYNWAQFSEMRNVNATFIMQGDGNLVSYLNGVAVVVIQSGHPGAKAYLTTNEMSITDGASNQYWVSGKGASYNNQSSRVLYLRPDAHLDIYYNDIGDPNKIWSSVEWCPRTYHFNKGSLSKQFMIKQYNSSVPSISQTMCLGIDQGVTAANNTPVKCYNNTTPMTNGIYWQLVLIDPNRQNEFYIKLANSSYYLAYDPDNNNALKLVDEANRTYNMYFFGKAIPIEVSKWIIENGTDNYSSTIYSKIINNGITFQANGTQAKLVGESGSLINLTW